MRRAHLVAVLAVAWVGCRGIPTYRFEEDAGGSHDAALALDSDSGAEPPHDAGIEDVEPADGLSEEDAADDASGCPVTPPPVATTCCNQVPCAGDCADSCAACEARCRPGEVCCAKRSTVLCKRAAGFTCN